MANTHNIFEPLRMASQDVVSYDRSIVSTTDLDNGYIVVETVPATNVYGSNELDTYTATAPANVTTENILVVDSGDVARIDGSFRIDVADPRYNYVPANVTARARQLLVGDEFNASAGCFAAAPTVGQFVAAANASNLWAASVADVSTITAKCACKVISTKTFSVGRQNITGYRLKVVKA